MKRFLIVPAALTLVALGSVVPASAGCVTGAVVGGIAGHMVGHGGVGAAAGCAYGAHKSKKARNATSAGQSGATQSGTH